jgi:hypothetical protein
MKQINFLLKNTLALVLTFLLFSSAEGAEAQRTSITSKPDAQVTKGSLSSTELNRVKVDRDLVKTLEVLESQNETIDYSSATKSVIKTEPGALEIEFTVINKATKKAGQFSKLVYQKDPRGKVFVFFDGMTPNYRPSPLPETSNARLQIAPCFGVNWGPWKSLGVPKCDGRFCPFKKFQGTFTLMTRTKNCRKGVVQTQTTWVFNSCGC